MSLAAVDRFARLSSSHPMHTYLQYGSERLQDAVMPEDSQNRAQNDYEDYPFHEEFLFLKEDQRSL
jgi:hypothetical protein